MGIKETAIKLAVKKGVKYLKEDVNTNSIKLIDKGLKLTEGKDLYHNALLKLREGMIDPNHEWANFVKHIIEYVDADIIEKLVPPFMSAFIRGYELRKEAQKKYDCNIPWAILLDPTTACNLKCTGCWAADYSKASQLTYDDITRIIKQGKEIGTFVYLYTGGEPLMRKKDLIRICEENPECLFISFTNGTLVDDAFADDVKRVGNLLLTISIEGNEETTDARRGKGTYQKVISAMEKLKARGIPFGASLCYTKANADVIASDEYADFLIDLGVIFAWYFTFVPVGADATNELMATAEQRELMYNQIRKWRFQKGAQKPIFTIDFFNDGEYVGGCVAGGKQYFHISANGDCEPCVFAHYSNVNIKDATLIDALQSPIFMAYRERQPFSSNMLRPCPVMDQPGALKRMVEVSGAKSTDLNCPEPVEDLFNKIVDVSAKWKETADRMEKEHGFINFRLRSISIYDEAEAKHVKDYKDFE